MQLYRWESLENEFTGDHIPKNLPLTMRCTPYITLMKDLSPFSCNKHNGRKH